MNFNLFSFYLGDLTDRQLLGATVLSPCNEWSEWRERLTCSNMLKLKYWSVYEVKTIKYIRGQSIKSFGLW